ncbi:MAG: C45 family peptidase [Thermovirgaceae bacterium]|nr:C45 family peptidase [Thermovirgaceae bacterium]
MADERYPFLKLSGNPLERGRLYGQTFRAEIEVSMVSYAAMFRDYSGVNWEEAGRRSLEFLPFIREYSPKLVEEMEGIAEGSQKDFKDILTLNSRSEIVLATQVDGCTAFGATPAVTSDGKTYLCQTWDWIRRQERSLVIIQIEQPPEPTVLMIAEAGVISGKGINSSGLGIGFNALTTGSGKPGVPVHILLRGLLDSPRLADAVQAVAVPQRSSSANFIIGSSEGEIIDIETSPDDFWVFYAEKGWISHTNHFTATFLPGLARDKGKVIIPDTFQRLGRINTLLAAHEGKIDFGHCKAFLSDHINHPDSICRHEDPRDPEGKQIASVYSTIMDLTDGVIWFSRSNPCLDGFTSFGPIR